MIPKIIHYCWFGRAPLPELARRCIASWRRYLPDYEIREWNEDNFDVNAIPYTAEAYAQGKYAFVSDYARFWILYKHGGIYFDTDVEVIRPMDDIIARGNFMGCETDSQNKAAPTQGAGGVTAQTVNPGLGLGVAPGLGLGVAPGLGLVRKMLDSYEGRHFEFVPGGIGQETVVHIATRILFENGMKDVQGIQQVDGVWIYPKEYFQPINMTSNRLHITPNTRTIHHYAATWSDKKPSLKSRLKRVLPEWLLLLGGRLKNLRNNKR